MRNLDRNHGRHGVHFRLCHETDDVIPWVWAVLTPLHDLN